MVPLGKPALAFWAVAFLTLAGCGGSPPETATSAPPSTMASTTAAPTLDAPATAAPVGPRFVGVAGPGPQPKFTLPPVQPGADWTRVKLTAEMPAGTWFFAYIPLPPGHTTFEGDITRAFEVSGNANSTGPAARIAFAPFLLIEDAHESIAETFNQEAVADYGATGAAWQWSPALGEITPFGDTHYAGIVVMAAANTPWHLDLSLRAPWAGNLTVGPEQVSWGRGFQAVQLPPMTVHEAPDESAELAWSQEFGPGWLGVRAASACYQTSPCTDAALQEDWTFTFPQAKLQQEFHRTSSGGTTPCCFFGAMDLPAGPLEVEGKVSGLTGPRTIQAFHVPVPATLWPFPLTATDFYWPD